MTTLRDPAPRELTSTPPQKSRRRAAAVFVAFDYLSIAITFAKGIALVPLYLSRFDLNTYGLWLATGNVLAMFSVVDGGLGIVFTQTLASTYGQQDRNRFALVAGTGGVLLAGVCVAFGIVSAAAATFLPRLLGDGAIPHSLVTAFQLAAVGSIFSLAQTGLQAVVYAWQDTFFAGVVKVTIRIVDIVTTVAALFAGFGVVALGAGMLVSGVIGFVLTAGYVFSTWRSKNLPRVTFDSDQARSLLRTTGPVFAGRVGGILVNNSDALLASAWLGPSVAAILVLNDRALKLVSMLANPLAAAAFPGLAHLSGNVNHKDLKTVLSDLFLLSGLVTALTIPVVLAMNRSFMSVWVGPDHYGGVTLTILLACTAALLVRTNLLGVMVPALGDIKQASWCMIAELITRLPLAIVLMPRIGIAAIPLATLTTTTLITFNVLTRLLGRRIGERFLGALRLQAASIVLVALVTIIGVVTALLVPPEPSLVALAVQTVLIGTAMGALSVAGAFLFSGKRSLFALTGLILQRA